MSRNIHQIYVDNPSTGIIGDDLIYLGKFPYGITNDSAILFNNFQLNITQVGTIAVGTWNGGVISAPHGGTGADNGSSTITLGGSVVTAGKFNTAGSGAFDFTATLTGDTNVTFPTSGMLGTGTVIGVTGTLGRITASASTTNPVIDIDAGYVGQSSITTVGNITTGSWGGSVIPANFGGTGVANSVGSTITLGGSFSISGAFTTLFTVTANTSVTFPTSGTLLSVPSALTTGSVLFSNSGVVSQDNANFFWDSTNHVMGLGTATVNINSQIIFGGTKAVSIYDTSVRNGDINLAGIQSGYYDSCTYASAGSHTKACTIFSAPLITVALGQTLVDGASFIAQPIVSSNSGTVSKLTGFLSLAGGTSGGTGTLTAVYGFYGEAPLSGTARVAAYFANAAIGYTAVTPPSNGVIIAGNVSVGSNSATSQFNVGSSNQFQVNSSGVVLTGTWNGSLVTPQFGGTGIANAVGSTITLGGAFSTTGAFTTAITVTANTAVTFPTSGTLVNTAVSTLSNLSSIGTITTGVWNASIIAGQFGGTGKNNGVKTIDLAFVGTGYVLTSDASGNGTWQADASVGTQIIGTAGQVLANGTSGSSQTGAVTLTLPQSILTTSNVTFGSATLSGSNTNVINGAITQLNGGNCFGERIVPNMSPATLAGGTVASSIWDSTFTLPASLAATQAVQIYINPGAASLGAGSSITTGYNLLVTNPAFGTTKYAAAFLGAVQFGTSAQTTISAAGSVAISAGTLAIGLTSTVKMIQTAGTYSAREIVNLAGTNTFSTNALCIGMLQEITISPPVATTTNTLIHSWFYPNFSLTTGAFSTAYAVLIDGGSTTLSSATIGKGFGLFISNPSFGTEKWCLGLASNVFVTDTPSVPGTPTGGGALYSQGGAGKWKGSSGTITTFGPAEPHCEVCDSDFGWQWENPEKYGHFRACARCLFEEMGLMDRPYVKFTPKMAA